MSRLSTGEALLLACVLSYPWKPVFTEYESGVVCITVPPLDYLEVWVPDRETAEREWHDALTAHLQGYIASGKSVPYPE